MNALYILSDILFSFPDIPNRVYRLLQTLDILLLLCIYSLTFLAVCTRYYTAIYVPSSVMCKTLILLTLAVIAAADSGIQPVARSPIFAGARLARRQGTCAEFGGW